MKNYLEIADDVLRRGNTIRENKRKRRHTLMKAASLIVPCLIVTFSLVVLVANGLLGGAGNSAMPPIAGSPPAGATPSSSHDSDSTPPTFGSTDPPAAWPPTEETAVKYGTLVFGQGASAQVSGQAAQKQQGTTASGQASSAPPATKFYDGVHAVCRAIEEIPGVHQALYEYGSINSSSYCLYKMQVLDPLDSGLSGEFYYLLPAHLMGDLCAYDAILLSMSQLPNGYMLRCQGMLSAYSSIFTAAQNRPELGNIIPFTDGIFDESLWQEESWLYGYQWLKLQLDEEDPGLVVHRANTLEQVLAKREALGHVSDPVLSYLPTTPAMQEALDYVSPFHNGVFHPLQQNWGEVLYRRYLNGIPTNEWVRINFLTQEVTYSDFRFEEEDLRALPDIAAYIGHLDLLACTPRHLDPTGKQLGNRTAVGWYEKTASGVYATVRITYLYYEEAKPPEYTRWAFYDETFLLLQPDRVCPVTREELIALIGNNPNISSVVYGAPMAVPS